MTIDTVLTNTVLTDTVLTNSVLTDTRLFDRQIFDLPLVDAAPLAGVASTMAALLAAMFTVAAVLKSTAPAATVSEFRDLGVPRPMVSARVVPAGELATAIALIVEPRLGAAMAAGLLVAFTMVLVATMRSGRSVSCGCLGALSRRPVSATTVARNVIFLAMAGLAASTSSLSRPDVGSVMVSLSLLVLAGLAVQLFDLRHTIGRVWSVELAGEAGARPDRTTTDMKGMTA